MPGVQHDIALDRIREIVSLILEIETEEIDHDAHFYEDLGADSLEKVEITVRVEREFEVTVSADEATEVSTVSDVLALLRAKGVVG